MRHHRSPNRLGIAPRHAAGLACLLALATGCGSSSPPVPPPDQTPAGLLRDFSFSLPLLSADSAWRQSATSAAVLPGSAQQMLVTYRVMRGDITDQRPLDYPQTVSWPYLIVDFDDFTIPIFRAGAGQQQVAICDYAGAQSWPGPAFTDSQLGGPVTVPAPAGTLRPNGPQNTGADGHLVLFDPPSFQAYDFWQATTVRDAPCASRGGGLEGDAILEAGSADVFDVRQAGSNPDGYSSAHAVGTALLGGMILPEDVASGTIDHALAFAIPGLRNLSADVTAPLPSDYFYPASTTETDFYSVNPDHLAAGQRLRLAATIVDDTGATIDEASELAPITRMFLTALRSYGAYAVDGADGFVFYAEDVHTARLDLSAEQVNALIGQPAGTPLPEGQTKWQVVMERLDLDLERMPIAYDASWQDGDDPATAEYDVANLEVVEPATQP